MFIAGAVSFFWLSGLIKAFLPLYGTSKTFSVRSDKRTSEFFNFFILIFIINILLIALLLLFLKSFSVTLTDNSGISYVNLLLIYLFFNNPTTIIEYIYLLAKKPVTIIYYSSITFFLQFLIVGLLPLLGYSLEYIFYALIFISLIRFIWLILLVFKLSVIQLSLSYIKEHLFLAFPLIFSLLLSGSAQYMDGFLVTWFFNDEQFAIFRYGAREFPLVVLFTNALSMAMLPEISKGVNMQVTLETITKKSLKIMHYLFPVTILLLVFSKYLYPIVFNKDFTDSASIFNTYLLLIIPRIVFPQTILTGLKKNTPILLASGLELLVNFIISIILLRYLDLVGIALGTFVAFITEKVFLITACNKYGIKPLQYIPAKWLLFYSLIMILVYVSIEYKALYLF
jgi:O-antigen/teichoic acid export membrane protein